MNDVKKNTVQVGWIDYWNLFPLKVEFEKQIKNTNISIRKEPSPRATNKKMLTGAYDLAPCSSIMLNQDSIKIAAHIGVACRGEVKSVFLGCKQKRRDIESYVHKSASSILSNWQEMDQQELTPSPGALPQLFSNIIKSQAGSAQRPKRPMISYGTASSTSAMMARVLFDLYWQEPNPSDEKDSTSLELVIGNEALEKFDQYPTKIDLSQLWMQTFGLPFVFATFAQPRELPEQPKIAQLLSVSAKNAEIKMRSDPDYYLKKLPSQEHSRQQIDLSDYWSKIYYSLGPNELRSLDLYLSLAKNHSILL